MQYEEVHGVERQHRSRVQLDVWGVVRTREHAIRLRMRRP